MADELYLSASAFFENRLTRRILSEHRSICEAGFVFLSARDPDLTEHFERKSFQHYGAGSPAELQASYRKMPKIPALYRSADINTSAAINGLWLDLLHTGHLVESLKMDRDPRIKPDFEETWARVPKIIGSRAFVAPHVINAFQATGTVVPSEIRLMQVLDPGYTLSHTESLGCGLVSDLMFLQTPWTPPTSAKGFSYRSVRNKLLSMGLLDSVNTADASQLLTLRLSASWMHLVTSLDPEQPKLASENVVDEVRSILERPTPPSAGRSGRKSVAQIGVLTALPEEWSAVVVALDATEIAEVRNDPNRYAVARLRRGRGRGLDVVVTFMPRMGTNSAATVATNLLRSFPEVDDLVFCGIAGGCPVPNDRSKHVRLGDIVVSDLRGIVQTDHQAVKDKLTKNRSAMPIPSRRLLNCVRLLEVDRIRSGPGWLESLSRIIKDLPSFARPASATDILLDSAGNEVPHPPDADRIPEAPKVVHGAIGSSNTLLRNSRARDKLAKAHDLRAFEMEGAGTAEAVWQFGKNYLVVRGICDYGDDRTKNDVWHHYAAAAAAAYTKSVLLRLM